MLPPEEPHAGRASLCPSRSIRHRKAIDGGEAPLAIKADHPPPPVEEIALLLDDLVTQVRRIADALDPPRPDVVDTPYVAARLGCTTTWIAELARKGAIPLACVVPGTGDGKPWKFFRSRIDEWIDSR